MNKKQKTENHITNSWEQKTPLIAFVITLIGSLLLIVTLFLPFASATEEYREHLQKYSDEMYAEEINMTNGNAVNLSLFEYGRMYAAAVDLGISKSSAIACLVIIVAYALFVIMTTLFTILKKPIAVLIFNLLSFGVFRLIKWDFDDRGVLPSSRYDWGFAEIVCYIGIAVVVVGAILLLLDKIRAKRQRKALVNE